MEIHGMKGLLPHPGSFNPDYPRLWSEYRRKIAIARRDEHLSVAVFVGVGLLHLDEVAIGLGHRVAPKWE